MAYMMDSFETGYVAMTSNQTVIIPAGCVIQQIVIENTTGNAVTGGMRIGTTNGGADVCTAITVGANALSMVADASILKRIFSMTVDTTLYIQAIVAWNSANLNFYFVLRKVR